MSRRIADFHLMELIEQELAITAEADLAVAEQTEEEINEPADQLLSAETPWRGIDDQMKNPMPKNSI